MLKLCSQVLRTHLVPSAASTRCAQTGGTIVQRRHHTSLIEPRSSQSSDSAAAILNARRSGNDLGASKGPKQSSAQYPDSKSPVQHVQNGATSTNSKSQQAHRKTRSVGERSTRGRGGKLGVKPAKAPLQDEAYIRKTMKIPSNSDYPSADLSFTEPRVLFVNNIRPTFTVDARFVALGASASQCTLTLRSAQHDEVVIGEGKDKKRAENAAYLHLLAKLHEKGLILDLLGTGLPSRESLTKNKDALVDIYNYAAKFDAIPIIERTSSVKRLGGRQRAVCQVTIALPEQEISVNAYAVDARTAEVAAALDFKAEAERHQAKQGNSALIIKDSMTLTVESASKFTAFLQIVRPGIQIEEVFEEVKNSAGSAFHKCHININGNRYGSAIQAVTKQGASDIARLTACVAVKKIDPLLWPRYLRALELGNGQILKPLAPIDMMIDEDCSLVMRETLLAARRAGLPDAVEEFAVDDATSASRHRGVTMALQPGEASRASEKLLRKYENYLSRPDLAELRGKRAELPMNQYQAKILDLVNKNTYSIIVGATGSGKTTQVPQIILEEATRLGQGGNCNIVCTQPRRIAAVSVANRVVEERAENLQESVGYHVRFDAKVPELGGSIYYCTTGILLQKLQNSPDEVLNNMSHVIIDEVHERDMLIDYLLIILKKNVLRRQSMGQRVPQIVLMSATIDTDSFAAYFQSEVPGQAPILCPSISIPGRTFPVRERYIDEILNDIKASKTPMTLIHADRNTQQYLESERHFRRENRLLGNATAGAVSQSHGDADRTVIDWKRERKTNADGDIVVAADDKENALIPFGLIACTISHIVKTTSDGAVLVFLPGLNEIIKLEEVLQQASTSEIDFRDKSRFRFYKLHSSVPDAQVSVFEKVPEGCRKIILSTNIAETSITIPDVQHVVDTGKLRERQYDQRRRITTLSCNWISKSNSKQRAGRAGRVQNGNYYALYSKERYDSLRVVGLPELLRSDLQEICLDVKSQAFDMPIRQFLAEAIEPPAAKAVHSSIMSLQALNALTDQEEITPLGRLLASLPVHPTLGKMIVLGIIFRCLDPMLVLGAASAERQLFTKPLHARVEAREAKLSFVEGGGSDHIALLNAVRALRRVRETQGVVAAREYAMRKYLHWVAFQSIDAIAKQIEEILVEAGLIPYTPAQQRTHCQYGNPSLNTNSHKAPLIKALILSGVHPNLGVSSGGRSYRTPSEKHALIHPSSINTSPANNGPSPRVPYGTLYSFSQLAKSNDGNALFLRDTNAVTPLMTLLFGGKLRREATRPNVIEVDNWLPFYIRSSDRRAPQTLVEFRKALERLLAGAFNELGTIAKRSTLQGQTSYLADARISELFAMGVVEALDRDNIVHDRSRRKSLADIVGRQIPRARSRSNGDKRSAAMRN